LSSKEVPPRKLCSRISRIVPSRRTRVPPLPPLSPSSTSEDTDTTSLAVPPLPDEEVAVSSGIQRLSTPTMSRDLFKSVDDAALNLVQLACSTVRVSTPVPSRSTINHRDNDDEVAVAAKLLVVTLTPIPTVMSPRTGSRHPTVLTSHPNHPPTTIVVVTLVVTFKGADHA
uniref:Secreted protein n=1 Tax=Echinococcus granulosus TaxID=6210 RepID=A0A7E4ZBZ1_ECHGR